MNSPERQSEFRPSEAQARLAEKAMADARTPTSPIVPEVEQAW